MFKWLMRVLFIFRAHKRGSKVHIRAGIKNPQNIHLGRKVKILAMAALDGHPNGCGIRLGDNVTINPYAQIQGHVGGIEIGDGSEINNFTFINGGIGGVVIGRNVLIGPHVTIVASNHAFDDPTVPMKYQRGPASKIVIEDDIWIGASAVILPGVTLGRGCIIGAGAIVTRSYPCGAIVTGVAATLKRFRTGFERCQERSE